MVYSVLDHGYFDLKIAEFPSSMFEFFFNEVMKTLNKLTLSASFLLNITCPAGATFINFQFSFLLDRIPIYS